MFGALRAGRARRWSSVAAVLGAFAVFTIATATPAHAIYAGMRNTLDGPAINGVVPTGVTNIDQCRKPGFFFDLTLTVTYGGTGTNGEAVGDVAIRTFTLSNGAGHFAGTKGGPAGANDNIYVKQGQTIVVGATDRWDVTKLRCS